MINKTLDSDEKYKKFVETNPKGHFMQSREWASLKSNWINEIITVEDGNGDIKASMSVLIRKVPFTPFTIMYCPRGPVCDVHNKEYLVALIEKAKILAKKYKSYVLKLDPDIEITDKEFLETAKSIGFRVKNASKNFEGIQPRFVFRMDIKGKSEEEVIKSFHQKTRYNINLAIKKGVKVKIGTREDIKAFHNVMAETGIRDKFVVRNIEYFEKMFDCLGPDHLRLYLAYYEGKLVAGNVTVLYGNKCWYLYGASSTGSKKNMPTYLLQWEMIKWAIKSGCEIYDFRGVSGDLDESNPLYGLYRFKKGFNGKLTEFVGDLDYVFKPAVFFFAENGEKMFRETRRKMFTIKNRLLK